MSRSSARRAQVEPLPALVGVLAVCLAVGAYAAVSAGVLSGSGGGPPADAVLADAVDAATPRGSSVVAPRTATTRGILPAGYEAAVTVTAGDREWTAGSSDPPPGAAAASTLAPVRVAPGRVRPGRVTVEVWT
ncbi:MAG: hypothetical protein ABEJ88_05080 [Halobacterium sp.]